MNGHLEGVPQPDPWGTKTNHGIQVLGWSSKQPLKIPPERTPDIVNNPYDNDQQKMVN